MTLAVEQRLSTVPTKLSNEDMTSKIIQIQSCLIQGHSFQAIMKAQTAFFEQATNASIMAICLNHHQQLRIDFLGTAKKQVLTLLKKYQVQPRALKFDNFLTHYRSDLLTKGKVLEIHSLEMLFHGLLTQSQYQQFEKEVGFNSVVFCPIFSYDEAHIGYVLYLYLAQPSTDESDLKAMTALIQTIVRPLYEPSTQTFYSQCYRVTNYLLNLTAMEKRVLRQLMHAKQSKDIAAEMHISMNTVKSHTKNIYAKLEVNSKMELFNKLKRVIF